MHALVSRIKDPELCYVFVKNARRNGHPELALPALYKRLRSRSVDEVQPVLTQLGLADYSFSAVEAAYPQAFAVAAA